jgi:ribosome-binding factor A
LGGQNASVALKLLNKNKGEIRFQLTKSVALKFSPDLKFSIDQTFDNIEKTQKLLSGERVMQDVNPSPATGIDEEPEASD